MDLPASAVEILQSTYAAITRDLKVNHKQRRKLWKKQKRRKKRVINFFAQKVLEGLSPEEEESSEDGGVCNDLPVGPLTNFAVISLLKSRRLLENTQKDNSVTGILKKASVNDVQDLGEPPLSHPLPPTKEVSKNNVRLSSEEQGDILPEAINEESKSVEDAQGIEATQPESPCVTEEQDCAIPERPKKETDEIQDLLNLLDEEVDRWQNPPAPPDLEPPEIDEKVFTNITHDRTEEKTVDNKPICSFYGKVGACRFGDKCSRRHEAVELSDTLLFPNMFQTFMFDMEDRSKLAGDTHDLSLEHSEEDLYEEFLDFYSDIEPEFQHMGKVVHLYVCGNRVHHLRGNVYVQYVDVESAKECYDKMFGRYYNGKPIYCKFIKVSSWNEAICGVYLRQNSCTRGGQCNFLHTFQKWSKNDNFNGRGSHRYHYRKHNRPEYHSHQKRRLRTHFHSYSSDRRRMEEGWKKPRRRRRRFSSERESSRSRSRSSSSSPSYRRSSRKRKRRSSPYIEHKSRSRSHKPSPKWVEKTPEGFSSSEMNSRFKSGSSSLVEDDKKSATEKCKTKSIASTNFDDASPEKDSISFAADCAKQSSADDSKTSKKYKKEKKKRKKKKKHKTKDEYANNEAT